VSKEEEQLKIRRILVALDASPHSLAALEAAADLAASFQAELIGLFVEDVNLLRLADLPFTREIGLFSARRRQIEVHEVERQLRGQARRVRRTFSVITQRLDLRGTFRVARGAITSKLLDAAADADMIILGKAGWSPIRLRQMGSTARAVALKSSALTVVLQDGTRLCSPIMLLYGDSPLAQKTLTVAARLVEEEEDWTLNVVIVAEGPEEAERMKEQAAQWLREHELVAEYYPIIGGSVPKLRQLIRQRCGTLILAADSSLLRDEDLATLLEHVEAPVMIVR
jgi:nucleotide-binding universal stress UspA family protein